MFTDQFSNLDGLTAQVAERYAQLSRMADDAGQCSGGAGTSVDRAQALAQALGRHVKAALLHLRQAEHFAELAGIDIDASAHDVPVAGLLRTAAEASEDLDLWAINNVRASGANPGQTYAGTGSWCQTPGGHLPDGSWPETS